MRANEDAMRGLSYSETATTPPTPTPHRLNAEKGAVSLALVKTPREDHRTARPSLCFATLIMRNRNRMYHMQVKIP